MRFPSFIGTFLIQKSYSFAFDLQCFFQIGRIQNQVIKIQKELKREMDKKAVGFFVMRAYPIKISSELHKV